MYKSFRLVKKPTVKSIAGLQASNKRLLYKIVRLEEDLKKASKQIDALTRKVRLYEKKTKRT